MKHRVESFVAFLAAADESKDVTDPVTAASPQRISQFNEMLASDVS